MGGLCSRWCCRPDNRKYLRTRYNVEREMSVEFDNLMDDEPNQIESQQYGAVMTDHERKLLSERKFHDIVQYQRQVDAEIEEQLREQEEQLRMEEEAFYEAKRQAARVARKLRSQELAAKQAAAKKTVHQSWLGKDADEYEISGEDFEQFLESVRQRSLNSTPAKTVPCQVHVTKTESRSVSVSSAGNSAMNSTTRMNDTNIVVAEVKVETNTLDNSNSNANGTVKSEDGYADFVSASVAPVTV